MQQNANYNVNTNILIYDRKPLAVCSSNVHSISEFDSLITISFFSSPYIYTHHDRCSFYLGRMTSINHHGRTPTEKLLCVLIFLKLRSTVKVMGNRIRVSPKRGDLGTAGPHAFWQKCSFAFDGTSNIIFKSVLFNWKGTIVSLIVFHLFIFNYY